MEIVYGDRIARTAPLRVAACGIIWDDAGRVLLTRRTDNGLWCLPGGALDPGETAAECVVRELAEETGLNVEATRLIGVYTDPHFIVRYADGNRWSMVVLSFECAVTGGTLGLSEETTEAAYFPPDDLPADIVETHIERIKHARQSELATFFS